MPLALLALTISAFAIGTTEFVIVGLIRRSALGSRRQPAVRRPARQPLRTERRDRRAAPHRAHRPRAAQDLLAALMALFTVGNLVAWQAPGYESLIVARILTGLAHGVFFSVGSIIATTLVPKERPPARSRRCSAG